MNKTKTYAYPAVFRKDGNFWIVKFPDFDSCYTQGECMLSAMVMAGDVLKLTIENLIEEGKKLPEPSEIANLQENLSNLERVYKISCKISK